MKIGGGIVLIVIGAILSFAVKDSLSGVDLTMIGYILMGGGVLFLLLSLLMGRRVSQTKTVNDPTTGDRVTQHESRGGEVL